MPGTPRSPRSPRRRLLPAALAALAAGLVPLPGATTPAAATTPDPGAAPAPLQAELVADGGFETGATVWRATTGSTLTLTTMARTGARAAALTRSSGGTVMLNDVPDTTGVPAGWACTASAWVLAPAGNGVHVRLRELAAGGTTTAAELGSATGTGAWQRLEASLVAGGGNLDLNVWASAMARRAPLLVDDVSLRCTPPGVLFHDGFGPASGVVTNEYATWNPTRADAVASPVWEATSGSLLARDGWAWTGTPDGASPDAASLLSTGSAVFRLHTRRSDFAAVTVAFRLRVAGLVTTDRTPATAWDGVHVFLRRQSEEQLYYASVNRRDGAVVIKKKCAGGETNGGTYYTLASTGRTQPIPFGADQFVAAGIVDNPDGSVTIRVWREGTLLLQATDAGTGCAPLQGTGAVGVRGDNAEFQLDDVTVRAA